MKRILFILCFLLLPLCSFAQDKMVYTTNDPAFDFIREYMPEYYYENHEVDGEPRVVSHNILDVDVRVMHNFKDEKTFTYLIIRGKEEHATLFTEEIPSLISYLERVLMLMKVKKIKDTNNYVYNSLTGLFFKAKRNKQSLGWPIFALELQFPQIEKVNFTNVVEDIIFTNEKEIQQFIFKLKSAEQYFPPKESDFRLGKEDEQNDNWKMKEVQEPGRKLKTT